LYGLLGRSACRSREHRLGFALREDGRAEAVGLTGRSRLSKPAIGDYWLCFFNRERDELGLLTSVFSRRDEVGKQFCRNTVYLSQRALQGWGIQDIFSAPLRRL
jgi:hypothetical protein